jgi:hypothetical protein
MSRHETGELNEKDIKFNASEAVETGDDTEKLKLYNILVERFTELAKPKGPNIAEVKLRMVLTSGEEKLASFGLLADMDSLAQNISGRNDIKEVYMSKVPVDAAKVSDGYTEEEKIYARE